MSDRETLRKAVHDYDNLEVAFDREDWEEDDPDRVILSAARERLAQMPEKCGTCGGSGPVYRKDWAQFNCPSCHGRGTVYPAALVERIARTLYDSHWPGESPPFDDYYRADEYRNDATLMLDALNDFAADKPGREG